MKISEKQISALIYFAYQYIRMLNIAADRGQITAEGRNILEQVCRILDNINDQQSDTLIDFKDEDD